MIKGNISAGSRRETDAHSIPLVDPEPPQQRAERVPVAVRNLIQSNGTWRSRDIAETSRWIHVLNDADRKALVDATRRALGKGRKLSSLVAKDFDLPQLRPLISTVVEIIHRGRGFVLLRGFPVDILTAEEAEFAYVCLGLQLGTPVSQDGNGSLLGHIRDEGIAHTGPNVRLYRTNERQEFHTDGGDIVGLLCLAKAKSGGESQIASSYAVYNEILNRRPDLTEVLYQPFPWDRNDEQSPGDDPYFLLPVFHDVNGAPRIFFIGWYIRDSQRHATAPRLSSLQIEAIDMIEQIANDPEFKIGMDFEPGDIQLLSNAKILHSREAFQDFADSRRRRHLLRLWLTAHSFASVDDLLRGGIPLRR